MSAAANDHTRLIANLSHGARAGGYFLIVLGLFPVCLIMLVPLGIVKMSSTAEPDLWVGGIVPVALCCGLGFWLLDYPRRLRKLLAQKRTGYFRATVIDRQGPTTTGWHLKFEIELSSTRLGQGKQRYFEEPTWQTGDTVIICLLADRHRFFPKELTQRANIGYLTR